VDFSKPAKTKITIIILVLVSLLVTANLTQAEPMTVGSNFWNIGWHNKTDIFSTGWDNVSGSNPWNPVFLNEVSNYTCFRFMDWDETNHSPRVDFSERKLKTDPVQRPMAYEWMIDLCNRIGADMWVTLPHKANWDYSTHLANLVKYGSNAGGVPYTSPQASPVNPPLNSSLKVYVEYSNETWNGAFDQSQYCIDQGVALNLIGSPSDPSNIYYKGWAYHVYAAIRHFERWEQIFGVNNPRIVKVLAGQAGNSAVCTQHLRAINDPVCNPNNITFNAYAIAPYFGNTVSGGATDAIAQLRSDIQGRITDRVVTHYNKLHPLNIPMIGYEGGQHVTTSASTVNRNPEMYDLYIEYFDMLDNYMGGVFAHYCHVGTWSSGGAWGSMEYTGQPISQAHKYRALMNYIDDITGDPLPPVFTSDPILKPNAEENIAYSGSIAGDATDPNPGDILTFTKLSGPAWLTVAANGALSGTPTSSDIGTNDFTVQVSDGVPETANDTATLRIQVNGYTQLPPSFTSDPVIKPNAVVEKAFSGSLAADATDPNPGDTLTFSKLSGPAWLTVASNGSLVGTAALADAGPNLFNIQVSDGNGGTDTATLEINVLLYIPGGDITVCDSGSVLAGANQVTTASFNVSNGGSAGNYLVISAASESSHITGMTYAGQAMTQLHEEIINSGFVEFFGLANPPAGGTVNVTYSGNIFGTQIYGFAFLDGVNTASPLRAAQSLTQATGTGSIVLNCGTVQSGDFAMLAANQNNKPFVASVTPVDVTMYSGEAGASFSGMVAYDAGLAGGSYGSTFSFTGGTNREVAGGVILAAQPGGGPDLTGEGDINLADFAILSSGWQNACDGSNDWCGGADINQSGLTDITDLMIISLSWLTEMTQ
jgi:hypothetical protein